MVNLLPNKHRRTSEQGSGGNNHKKVQLTRTIDWIDRSNDFNWKKASCSLSGKLVLPKLYESILHFLEQKKKINPVTLKTPFRGSRSRWYLCRVTGGVSRPPAEPQCGRVSYFLRGSQAAVSRSGRCLSTEQRPKSNHFSSSSSWGGHSSARHFNSTRRVQHDWMQQWLSGLFCWLFSLLAAIAYTMAVDKIPIEQ